MNCWIFANNEQLNENKEMITKFRKLFPLPVLSDTLWIHLSNNQPKLVRSSWRRADLKVLNIFWNIRDYYHRLLKNLDAELHTHLQASTMYLRVSRNQGRFMTWLASGESEYSHARKERWFEHFEACWVTCSRTFWPNSLPLTIEPTDELPEKPGKVYIITAARWYPRLLSRIRLTSGIKTRRFVTPNTVKQQQYNARNKQTLRQSKTNP